MFYRYVAERDDETQIDGGTDSMFGDKRPQQPPKQ